MAQDEAGTSGREALGVLRAKGRDGAVRRPAIGSHARADVSGVAAARLRPTPAAGNKENSEANGASPSCCLCGLHDPCCQKLTCLPGL